MNTLTFVLPWTMLFLAIEFALGYKVQSKGLMIDSGIWFVIISIMYGFVHFGG